MKQTILILGIIFLIIGVSIASSTDNRVKDNPTNINISESLEVSMVSLSRGKIVYGFNGYDPSGELAVGVVCFFLDDPGNITLIKPWVSGDFFAGGTWTSDCRWLCCEFGSGLIWEVFPYDGYILGIGGGGVSLNGLSYNPINQKLYGASNSDLYEINIITGEQTLIGSFGSSPNGMIGIAFDTYGVLYGWDTGTDNIWTIDTANGEASLVGPLDIDIELAQDGAFDYETDILYLSAYNHTFGGQLYTCNQKTGQCTLIDDFQGGAEITGFAIPYNWSGPTANFTWTPLVAEPYMPVYFNASDSYDPDGYITLYEWDWDNDGIFDENHTCPNATHIWEYSDEFPVTLRVTDNDSLMGMITKYVLVWTEPLMPPCIKGPTSGRVGVAYYYEFSHINPDGDDISYFIDWGDNTTTGWTDYYACGEVITKNHTWYEKGDYEIKAKVKDIKGMESSWSTLIVKIPRDRIVINSFFHRFLDHFPLLQRLLDIWRHHLL